MKKQLIMSAIFLIGVGMLAISMLYPSASHGTLGIIKNLKNRSYPEQAMVAENINRLYEKAGNNEYRLGMIVFASAQQGNDDRYHKSLLQMQQASNKSSASESNSYKAWRMGRILLAADNIGDEPTVKITLANLKSLLSNNETKKDEFSAWAWGYLGALNKTEYDQARQSMLDAARALTVGYQTAKKNITSTSTPDEKAALQAKLSNALWAWVMDAQAAANARDEKTYSYILQQMRNITHQKSVSAALSIGLQRLSDSNDYPAWALSIVYLAAATIGDDAMYTELQPAVSDSIEGAIEVMQLRNEKTEYSAMAEATLAQLSAALATFRFHH